MYVELSHVSFAHAGGEPLFSSACQRFEAGVTAIVGENGAGKSTLLSLVAGDVSPQQGVVRVEPRGALIVRCLQGVEELEEPVRAFAESTTRTAQRVRGALSLDASWLLRWHSLSPGERRRFQLGACLAHEPDVLLLDEPTNHVDAEARILMVQALERFRGVCLLVSHDRALIDALARRTVRIHRGQLWSLEGGYSSAKEVWERARHDELARREAAVREVHKAERKLRDARRVQASAERNRSASARVRNRHDSDGRTMGARNMADWAEARAGRAVAVLRDEAEKSRSKLESTRVEKQLGRSLFARYEPCPRPRIAVLQRHELRRGEQVVLAGVDLTVERDARVRITGANGAGKTTLLHALTMAVPEHERVLHLAQELSVEEGVAWLGRTRTMPRSERGHVLELVAALGVDPDRLLASARPSPGEARKLVLAHGLARSAWALFLDEPTNHMDLPSVERLEAALAGYPGALVVVTHDPTFLASSLVRTWHLRDRALTVT